MLRGPLVATKVGKNEQTMLLGHGLGREPGPRGRSESGDSGRLSLWTVCYAGSRTGIDRTRATLQRQRIAPQVGGWSWGTVAFSWARLIGEVGSQAANCSVSKGLPSAAHSTNHAGLRSRFREICSTASECPRHSISEAIASPLWTAWLSRIRDTILQWSRLSTVWADGQAQQRKHHELY
jgi:hypothetical protein